MDGHGYYVYPLGQVFHPQTQMSRPTHNASIVSRRYDSTMASTPVPPSFFADEMYHHQRELGQLDDNFNLPGMEPNAPHGFQTVGFRPLDPINTTNLNTLAPPALATTSMAAPLPIPGILHQRVDQTQYQPVYDNEWVRASIDYGAPSPTSVDSTSPLTPSSETFGHFTQNSFRTGQHVGNPVAERYFAEDSRRRSTSATVAPATLRIAHQAPNPALSGSFPQGPFGMPTANYCYQPPNPPSFNVFDAQSWNHNPDMSRPRYMPLQVMKVENTPPIFDPVAIRQQSADYSETAISDDAGSQAHSSDEEEESDEDPRAKLSETDAKLLRLRAEGLPYKEIKKIGDFKEAESTLRGRHRMLIKPTSERVRKPKWTKDDVSHATCQTFTSLL
jgi:hypothetical protein